MEVLIHFVFELIKISILASIYATLLLLIFLIIGKFKPNSLIKQMTEKKSTFWVLSGFFISIGLFFFMFTYWGNHGLGDGPRIPIGHGITVENVNWTEYGYLEIETSDNIKIEMTKFKVVDNNLIGNLDSSFYDYNNSYFIYNMDNETLSEFNTKKDYDDFASENELPLSNRLLTFEENYHNRWSGWRFWILP